MRGPASADRAQQPAQEGLDLGAAWPFGGTEHGRDEAALAVEHDNWLKAVFVVMRVEQPQLRAAVHRVERVVDIERDPFGNLGKRLAREVDHRTADSRERAAPAGSPIARSSIASTTPYLDGVRSSAILNIGSLRRDPGLSRPRSRRLLSDSLKPGRRPPSCG